MVQYSYGRLCFKADVIEHLNDDDIFAVHTPVGVFQMSKAEFYNTFPNIVKTESYQKGRLYSMKTPTREAMQFLTDVPPNLNIKSKAHRPIRDLIGNDIREKIREIGRLWRMSEHNPRIDNDVLQNWEHMIDEWIADKNMPLIIRKDTNKRGQSFIHACGREIIVSDNTFAIWVYHCVMNGMTYTLSQLKEMLSCNDIPMVFIQTKDILKKGKYTRPLGAYSLPEWKLCHIEPIGFNSNKSIEELDILDIQEHFRKYANPCNMFVLPKEIGDLGEIQIFIDEQKTLR